VCPGDGTLVEAAVRGVVKAFDIMVDDYSTMPNPGLWLGGVVVVTKFVLVNNIKYAGLK
jgi:hypothetical protein